MGFQYDDIVSSLKESVGQPHYIAFVNVVEEDNPDKIISQFPKIFEKPQALVNYIGGLKSCHRVASMFSIRDNGVTYAQTVQLENGRLCLVAKGGEANESTN